MLRARNTADDAGSIQAELGTSGQENGRSVVTITDNAGGIAGDIIEKVFDPYFTTKDSDKGMGIGLFMSKTIMRRTWGEGHRAQYRGGGGVQNRGVNIKGGDHGQPHEAPERTEP